MGVRKGFGYKVKQRKHNKHFILFRSSSLPPSLPPFLAAKHSWPTSDVNPASG